MRAFSAAVLVTVAALFSSSGVAVAAPKDYCADLKGGNTGSTCEIQLADPGYSVDISIPLDYPDQKSVADYVSQTRDAFLNTAKSGAARTAPYELKMTPTEYSSAIPPRGTQAVAPSRRRAATPHYEGRLRRGRRYQRTRTGWR